MLTRWNRTMPSLDEFRRRVEELFAEPASWYAPETSAASFPRVNLYDEGDHLLLMAEVPGLTEKQLQVTTSAEVMTLTGEAADDTPQDYTTHRKERAPLRFTRAVTFPCKVDPERISAVLKDGLLSVTIAKSAEARPRHVTVKAH